MLSLTWKCPVYAKYGEVATKISLFVGRGLLFIRNEAGPSLQIIKSCALCAVLKKFAVCE